uniref:AlNc14C41G3484 protein n=1 Tax=Albugo laibachii Nc14 TaxID=890382 RepID=F0W9M9_9STRA|nr:AlNc14C41G3484 [Albugo laibachii Nc14]|eukprot:CCA17847.1 AlNc14C41G3484 [Albugo laibachii Nc14]
MQRFTPNTQMMPSNMKRSGGGYIMRHSPAAAAQQPRQRRMSEVPMLKKKNAELTLALAESKSKLCDAMEHISTMTSRIEDLENDLQITLKRIWSIRSNWFVR